MIWSELGGPKSTIPTPIIFNSEDHHMETAVAWGGYRDLTPPPLPPPPLPNINIMYMC